MTSSTLGKACPPGLLLLMLMGAVAQAAVFTVNSTADTDDGSCDAAAGGCTLREAIGAANALAGLDAINFDPAVFPSAAPATIAVTSVLPILTDPAGTEVDGTGAGVILDGAAVPDDNGLDFNSAGDLTGVTLRTLTVQNFDIGVNVNAGGSLTDTTVAGCTFRNNGSAGINLNGGASLSRASFSACTAINNDDTGINVNAGGSVSEVSVFGCLLNDNGGNGVNVNAGADLSDASISGCTISGNADSGVNMNARTDNVRSSVTGNELDGNGDAGININAGNNLTDPEVSGNSCANNEDQGFNINSGAVNSGARVTNNTASGNGDDGFQLTAGSMVSNAVLEDNQAINNGIENEAAGFEIFGADSTNTIVRCLANGNGEHGFSISGTGDPQVQLSECTANDNVENGFSLSAVARIELFLCTARNNGGNGVEVSSVRARDFLLDRCWVQGNDENGVSLVQVLDPTAGPHEVVGCIICENGISGLIVERSFEDDALLVVQATGNWWGDASGPTHPSNPGGSGDAILDDAAGGTSQVVFDPFIDTIASTGAAIAASAGVPVDATFQFSGGGGTVFLGPGGPGDTSGTSPFTLTTDNGVLTASTGTAQSVGEFINESNGILRVTLTPAFDGEANVVLTGPCGLISGEQPPVTPPVTPPGTQPTTQPSDKHSCGIGLCGTSTLSMLPFMLAGLGWMKLTLARGGRSGRPRG